MSLFKEIDDKLKEHFKSLADSSDDESLCDLDEETHSQEDEAEISHTEKKPKLDEEQSIGESFLETDENSEKSLVPTQVSNVECINLDCDDDDDVIKEHPTIDNQIITISSDDEEQSEKQQQTTKELCDSPCPKSLNVSNDLEDHDFNLKLTLSGTYKQFRTTYRTKLSEALKELLDNLRSSGRNLIITSQSTPISLDESPYSLKLSPGTILKAIEVLAQECPQKAEINPNEISIKLQDGNRKHTKEFKVILNEPILELKKKYAKEFDVNSIDKVKFLFDGDIVEDDSTPEELEIEDGCVIDVLISK